MAANLEITNLTVSRGGRSVLRNVNLTLEQGKITALLGPNGAGKSSLVLAMAGLLPIDSGDILLDGQSLVGKRADVIRRAGVAAVPEGHHVLTDLTVEENFLAAGSLLNATDLDSAVENVFSIFNELQPLKTQLAGTLSGGQQQMVALGHALIGSPKFMLADELSLGLAPMIVQRLVGVVEEVAQSGIGVLLIEQFTHIALKLADYVYVLDRGQIRFAGTPAELEQKPEILRAAYLGEMN